MNASISAEAFSDFLDELRAAGYSADINQMTAAYQLLLLVASGDWAGGEDRVTNLLAPLFARTPAQQADFHSRFANSSGRIIVRKRRAAADRQPALSDTPREPTLHDGLDDPGPLRKLRIEERRLFVGYIVAALFFVAIFSLTIAYFWPDLTASSSSPSSFPKEQPSRSSASSASSAQLEATKTWSMYTWPVAIPLSLALLPPCIGLALWFAGFRRQSLWAKMATESPRDLSAIRIVSSDAPIFEDADMDVAARDLSRHRRLRLDEPDILRSIDETVRRGGLATLVMIERSVTPQYVFLIEETSAHDHVARTADLIVDRLNSAGVISTRYYIGSPSLVRNASGEPANLSDLPILHSGHRLIVIGPGEATVHYGSGELCSALDHDHWADHAYWVAGAIDRSTAVRLVSAGYAVAPATIEGIRIAARYMASALREGGLLSHVPGLASDPHRSLID
jgi:hypothetical protein